VNELVNTDKKTADDRGITGIMIDPKNYTGTETMMIKAIQL